MGSGTGPAGTAAGGPMLRPKLRISLYISELGSADSEIIQSINLNMLRVREQDAALKRATCCSGLCRRMRSTKYE